MFSKQKRPRESSPTRPATVFPSPHRTRSGQPRPAPSSCGDAPETVKPHGLNRSAVHCPAQPPGARSCRCGESALRRRPRRSPGRNATRISYRAPHLEQRARVFVNGGSIETWTGAPCMAALYADAHALTRKASIFKTVQPSSPADSASTSAAADATSKSRRCRSMNQAATASASGCSLMITSPTKESVNPWPRTSPSGKRPHRKLQDQRGDRAPSSHPPPKMSVFR